jgi:hypothetical protein
MATSNGNILSFGDAPADGTVLGLQSPTPAPSPAPAPSPSKAPSLDTNPLVNPPSNLAPNPNYYVTCSNAVTDGQAADSVACNQAAVAAINNGRASEGLPPLTLPSGFYGMPGIFQTFILTNEERISRGLTPFYGLASSLDSTAMIGALANTDPPVNFGPNEVARIGSNVAVDFSPAAAMYDWMYNDGWGGSRANTTNFDCTSATSSGCWGHRDNILMADHAGDVPIMGAAFIPETQATHPFNGAKYFTVDATIGTFTPQADLKDWNFIYTWSEAVADGA